MPHPGWAEQDPEDWRRAAEEALSALGVEDVAGIGLTGQMHGLVALDADRRVLRPAILWNDQRTGGRVPRDRGARRPRPPDRADREPGAPGFHRAQAPLAARARAGGLRAHRARPPPQGLRPPRAHRRARHGRRRRVGDAALRRRRAALERRGARRAGAAGGVAASGARVSRRLGETAAGIPVAAGAGDQAAGALGVGVTAPGPVSVVLGTSGVVFAALPAFAADPEARRARLLPRRAGHLARDGRDALRRRLAAVAPGHASRPGDLRRADRRGRALAAGRGGPRLPALPRRRAHAARRPGRARRLRGPLAPPRPGRPRPRGARGRRVRPPRLAGDPARARLPPATSGASRAAGPAATSGRGSSPPSSGCPSSGRWWRRAPPTAPRCSAASPAACSPTSTRRSPRASASATRSSPTPSGSGSTRTATAATALSIRPCDPWRRHEHEVGSHLDRAHQPARPRGRARVRPRRRRGRGQPRPGAAPRRTRASTGSSARTGATRRCSRTPTWTPIYISLPNSLHVEWSIRALEAGKHVLCEKPLDRRPEEVERAFDAADRAGRILMEAFMYRHNPQTAKLRELVDGGAIGELAGRPLGLQLQPRRAGERPPRRRPRRRRAHGRRLLLRQRLAAARRRARAGLRRAARRRERGGRALRRDDALPRGRRRALRLRLRHARPRRARGGRLRGLALPRRPVARATRR